MITATSTRDGITHKVADRGASGVWSACQVWFKWMYHRSGLEPSNWRFATRERREVDCMTCLARETEA